MDVMIGATRISYETFGDGMPLLLLHGWPGDHRHMLADFEPLFAARSGWRRIYPDLPGMVAPLRIRSITNQDQMLDATLAFIDAVAPGQRIVVAGTSYGGYLARGLIHARGAHVAGMALIVPNVELDKTKRQYPPHQVLAEDPAFLAALGSGEQNLVDMVVAQSLPILKSWQANYTPAFAIADHAFLKQLAQRLAFSFDVDVLPAPFPAPTLILTGRYDLVCGYREAYRLLDSYPRATFAVLDRAGHLLALEQPSLFRTLVSEWLDRVEEYAAKTSS